METQNAQSLPSTKTEFYRFKLMQGNLLNDEKFERTKTVGMAYLANGSNSFTLKLWTLLKDRFYLVPRKQDPSSFLVLTREPSKNPELKHKNFSNIVGNAKAYPMAGIIRIEFDLFEKPIFMSIYPEAAAQSSRIQQPEMFEEAA